VRTVQVLLVMHSVFNVFRVITFPIQVKSMEGRFNLIQFEKEFIVTDVIKGFHSKLGQVYSGVEGYNSRN